VSEERATGSKGVKQMAGYCKGCNQVFPIGPLAGANIARGVPGYCVNIGKVAVVVFFPKP